LVAGEREREREREELMREGLRGEWSCWKWVGWKMLKMFYKTVLL
jgi:hypothetical protein